MITIIKQTYNERVEMYNKCTSQQLVSFLVNRDKYHIAKLPWYLKYNIYDNLSHEFLCELLAERDIIEMPNQCK